jgi:predicted lipoprotein with Yx(FWY)xxD motif
MNTFSRVLPVVGLGCLLSLSGWAQAEEPATVKDGKWVDAQGMTLYTYDRDVTGNSKCYKQCAENWPPLEAPAGAKGSGAWSVDKRTDGTQQWVYNGKPLYRFAKDQKPGDTEGDGKMGNWHVAQPE